MEEPGAGMENEAEIFLNNFLMQVEP